jgi:tetratricopeptide (TPR) repeat protein
MPGVLMQLGVFYATRGDAPAAEASYREALAINWQMIAAYLNLADLLRAQQRDEEARTLLLKALEIAPENGNTLHALGLLETRSGSPDKALDYLRRSAELETQGTRHGFVYAIALHDLGKPREAITQLNKVLRQSPGDQQVLLALANYHAELGDRNRARGYAQQLLRLSPNNQHYQQLLQSFSN